MSFESFESFEVKPEAVQETADAKLGSFQNPIWTDMFSDNLMPKIRFTTDKAEAEEAARADRSNPFDLPDAVFYVEPKGDAAGETAEQKSAAPVEGYTFQNPSFGIDVSAFPRETGEAAGEYAGPSPDMINLKIESDVKNLTHAQEQLEEAIERGTGVMQAMRNVESAQKVLDARMKLYNEAVKFRPPEATVAAAAQPAEVPGEAGETGEEQEAKLGSVSHAKWRLEKAYESGSQAEINAAKRYMAQEKAKEEAEK